MGLFRMLITLGVFVILYFAFQYATNPDEFKTPTDLINEQSDKVKEITVTITNSQMNPSSIALGKEDRAAITFKSTDLDYELSVEQLGFIIRTNPEQESLIRLTKEPKGTYIISCLSPCSGDELGSIVIE